MRRFVAIGLIFLFLGAELHAQTTITINQSADDALFDPLGNLYLVKQAALMKYDAKGQLLFQYQDAMLGTISEVDAGNPLRLLLFYKEASTIVFLNQQLAPIADPVDCFDVFGFEVTHACTASDGGFWMYSNEKQRIVHSNNNLEIDRESQSLVDWITDNNVISIKEKNQKIYLVLQNKMLVFDVFGTYLTTHHYEHIVKAFIEEQTVVIFNGKCLLKNYFLSKQTTTILLEIPDKNLGITYMPGKVAFLLPEKVDVYEGEFKESN